MITRTDFAGLSALRFNYTLRDESQTERSLVARAVDPGPQSGSVAI